MLGYALYKNNDGWYWIENDVPFGPYEDYWQLQGEKLCVVGSLKHEMLSKGQLELRPGDYVKSKHLLVFGWLHRRAKHSVLGNGWLFYNTLQEHQDFMPDSDVQFAAPVEWSEID